MYISKEESVTSVDRVPITLHYLSPHDKTPWKVFCRLWLTWSKNNWVLFKKVSRTTNSVYIHIERYDVHGFNYKAIVRFSDHPYVFGGYECDYFLDAYSFSAGAAVIFVKKNFKRWKKSKAALSSIN